jgi:hypothetical protein
VKVRMQAVRRYSAVFLAAIYGQVVKKIVQLQFVNFATLILSV